MLEPYRCDFNRSFKPAAYLDLISALEVKTEETMDFRVCETPCFIPKLLLEEMAAAGREMTLTLTGDEAYRRASNISIPERYGVPNESSQPNFMTVDFGFVREADGNIGFKLVELQAFPSVYGYQDLLSRQYVRSYGLPESLRWHLGEHTEESYWRLLDRVVVGAHDPRTVVLLEVSPEKQKTRSDFRIMEQRLGITTVDIAKVLKQGSKLFYVEGGQPVPIERIYNRAIVDEIEREGITPGFDHREDLDVEWAGHPNWYFRGSKFSLPFLKHPSVPRAVFLDEWFRGSSHLLPAERDQILLKPLYSFAGKGIQFAPTEEDLRAIPEEQRHLYLLQERVNFEPVIETPFGPTQAEVRIMYLWPDGGELEPVISLVRLGRGLMMGVDHNRNQEWVGGSAALFPEGESVE